MNNLGKFILVLSAMFTNISCAPSTQSPIPLAEDVDLKRFMGEWYVIAAIPTFIETDAYNPIESYQLLDDGSIDTVFTFNKGSLDGPKKRYNPRGFVVKNTGNARWKMQFVWPIKAEYLIAHVNSNYNETIIARNARDYVWIMTRSPDITEETYQRLLQLCQSMGYDLNKMRRAPHRIGQS